MNNFRNELERLINQYSLENGSNTPDFILAGYLEACLDAFDSAVKARSQWYGRHDKPGASADGASGELNTNPTHSDFVRRSYDP